MRARPLSGSGVACALPGVLITLAGAAAALGADPFPAVITLSTLNGTDGYVINGIAANDLSGESVSAAGDVNGDGIGDILIGAFRVSSGGYALNGEAYVVFGGPAVGASGAFNLSALTGSNGFAMRGRGPNHQCGRSVSSAGDVNGDGIGDVIVGARGASPNGLYAAGESYVVFGRNTPFAASMDLGLLSGATGFALQGIDALDYSGFSVSGAGDVNGDGVDDVIVGAYSADPNAVSKSGESYVVFGGPGVGGPGTAALLALNGTNGFVLNGIDMNDFSGWTVSDAGDINGDGVGDVVIGAQWANPNAHNASGETYVVFGKDISIVGSFAASIELSALNGSDGFVLNGIDTYDRSALPVASAGDVNGDGIDDLLIGAYLADPNGQSGAGETYIIFGAVGIGASGTLNLSTLNGTNGFTINGASANDGAGLSAASAGDVNDDGYADVVIGAYHAVPDGQVWAGMTYVVFGGPGVGASGSVNLSSLNGTNGFALQGDVAYDRSGISVSSAGDVNGDGVDDILIGASRADPNGLSSAGQTYVVFGRGPAAACPGDITGDGATNSADFNVLASNFGAGPGATPAQGDLTGDGFVNSADFNVLAADFGCAP